MSLNAEECLIEPDDRPVTVNRAYGWLKGGNPRGFRLQDKTLIVFDGYGNTHDSMKRFFKLSHIDDDFIIQKTGDIAVLGLEKKFKLEFVFTPDQCRFFRALALRVGNNNPALIPMQ